MTSLLFSALPFWPLLLNDTGLFLTSPSFVPEAYLKSNALILSTQTSSHMLFPPFPFDHSQVPWSEERQSHSGLQHSVQGWWWCRHWESVHAGLCFDIMFFAPSVLTGNGLVDLVQLWSCLPLSLNPLRSFSLCYLLCCSKTSACVSSGV